MGDEQSPDRRIRTRTREAGEVGHQARRRPREAGEVRKEREREPGLHREELARPGVEGDAAEQGERGPFGREDRRGALIAAT